MDGWMGGWIDGGGKKKKKEYKREKNIFYCYFNREKKKFKLN